ncbi:hypothetical protein ACFPC0_29160 [Streptomyces andamanensis]|uniref:Secreted protein n=1 Tax=Streptomyces andamanensis TaxID=1565035 RepID=A0ABV8TM22_9ACTN
MEAVIAVFAVLFLLCLGVGAYATVKAVGAAKRGVDRTIHQARRAVEDQTLRAKSFAQPGPAGELAQLRLGLRTSMRATQDALYAGATEDESLKESVALFERLSIHGRELDHELKRLESEPNRATLAERLPALAERTRRVTDSADALRWAAHDRARRFADDDLDVLSDQIGVEADALRHWTSTGNTGGTDGPGGAGGTGPGASRPDEGGLWPSPDEQAARPSSDRERDRGQARDADRGGDRPALTEPVRRPTYSWQKKPRPESTT